MNFLLNPVANILRTVTGLEIQADQLVFFVALYICLGSSYLFRNVIQPSNLSKSTKLSFITGLGIWIYYFIWGWNILLVIANITLCYLLMQYLPIKQSPKYVFICAMSFLSFCHVHIMYKSFQKTSEDDSSADFTGPIMVITQRITSLSYSISDGMGKKYDDLNESQKRYAVRKLPSLLEYFAYMFSVFGIMAGPLVFYKDYESSVILVQQPRHVKKRIVWSKVVAGMMMIVTYWIGGQLFPYRKNIDEDFILNESILYRFTFLYLSLFVFRAKYYGVWLFADALNNAAGIGYNGLDENKKEKWDLVSNINILKIETATGLKDYIDNWNIMTARWLRMVAYDRLPAKYRTSGSFLLSAVWHGFYPGYYIMFFSCHIFLTLQRKFRRAYRQQFQTTAANRFLYGVVTLIATQSVIAYSTIPFVVLEWTGSVRFYKSIYFVGHFICVFLILLTPTNERRLKTKTVGDQTTAKKHLTADRGDIGNGEIKSNGHSNNVNSVK